MVRVVEAGVVRIGGAEPLALIAGPCVIEGEEATREVALFLKSLCEKKGMPLIFKSSFDKANRSSVDSYRGPGLEKGLKVLEAVKEETGLPLLVDVHCREQVAPVAAVAEVLQVPAFLCRQTDLLLEAARSGRAVNVKKGQFLSPWDARNIVEKVESAGNRNLMLTERGVSFGYNTLVNDMRSLPILRGFGYPVVFDATHSVQAPGGLGKATGGKREFVPPLARAAVAAGCDALFLEVHPEPDRAPSDGPNMIPLGELEALLDQVLAIDGLVRKMGLRG